VTKKPEAATTINLQVLTQPTARFTGVTQIDYTNVSGNIHEKSTQASVNHFEDLRGPRYTAECP
jgi:hypothetical protein